MPMAGMQISPDPGQFMALLVKATGVKRALEVGTFTGYSALVVAVVLPEDGLLVACDVSEEYTAVACRHRERVGVEAKIDLRLGPVAETLDAMIAAGEAGRYDLAFVDADKESYTDYYEPCLTPIRQGAILVDNMLWGGRVADPANEEESTQAIRDLTRRMHADERVEVSLLTVGDGLALAVQR